MLIAMVCTARQQVGQHDLRVESVIIWPVCIMYHSLL